MFRIKFDNMGVFSAKPCADQHKPAFTLAEVLITLGIIGVVAAMTLPALIQKIMQRHLKLRLKNPIPTCIVHLIR